MSMQSQLVHTLEEQAGLDEATAERVAQVAIDFSKEHSSELISENAAEALESMAPEEGAGGIASELTTEEGTDEAAAGSGGEMGWAVEGVSEITGEFAGIADERVSDIAYEFDVAEEHISTEPSEIDAAKEDPCTEAGEVNAADERGVDTAGETTSERPGGLSGLVYRLTGH